MPGGSLLWLQVAQKYGRITKFFHELDSKVYLTEKALFTEELDRLPRTSVLVLWTDENG